MKAVISIEEVELMKADIENFEYKTEYTKGFINGMNGVAKKVIELIRSKHGGGEVSLTSPEMVCKPGSNPRQSPAPDEFGFTEEDWKRTEEMVERITKKIMEERQVKKGEEKIK